MSREVVRALKEKWEKCNPELDGNMEISIWRKWMRKSSALSKSLVTTIGQLVKCPAMTVTLSWTGVND